MRSKIFFFFLLLLPIVPYFGSIDIIGPQWLYLSIFNFFFLIDLFFLNPVKFSFSFKSSNIFLIYFAFIILAWLSLLYSNNLAVTFLDLFRLSSIFILTLLIEKYYSLLKVKNFILLLLTISCFFESVYALYPFLVEVLSGNIFLINYDSIPNSLLGVAGNKNITIASILIKLPFVFLFFNAKSYVNYLSIFVITFFVFLSVYLISARSSFISFFIITSIYFLYEAYSSIKHKSFRFGFTSFISSTLFVFFTMSTVVSSSKINISERVSSIQFSDESSSNRLSLWSDALDYIGQHPILGCGLGNWKIESLPYWKNKLSGYTVPYHAHNDFLELATELGVLGGFTYLLIFIASFFALFKSILFAKNKALFIFLLSSLTVYFVDANLNFPLERPLMQVMFALVFAIIIVETEKYRISHD